MKVNNTQFRAAGTLEDGGVYSSAFGAALYVLFALVAAMIPALIAAAAAENSAVYLYSLVFPVAAAPLLGYFVFSNAAKQLKIGRCMKDGVVLRARCDKVLAEAPKQIRGGGKYVKIRVTFEYRGRTVIKYSGREGYTGKGSFEKMGFADINVKYANRDIIIMYSPSQDCVLLPAEGKRAVLPP